MTVFFRLEEEEEEEEERLSSRHTRGEYIIFWLWAGGIIQYNTIQYATQTEQFSDCARVGSNLVSAR